MPDETRMQVDPQGEGTSTSRPVANLEGAGHESSDPASAESSYAGVKARNTGQRQNLHKASDEIPLLHSFSSLDRALISVPFVSSQMRLQSIKPILEKELLLTTSYLTKRIINLDDKKEALDKLKRALERLKSIETSLKQIEHEMDLYTGSLKTRLECLESNRPPNKDDIGGNFKYDNYRKRISWVIAEYLTRKGYMASAKSLSSKEGLNNCVDIALNEECMAIYKELDEKKIDRALKWAEYHREAIASIGSTFWEDMKIQEVVMHLQRADVAKATALLRSFSKDIFHRCSDARKLYSAIVFLNVDISEIDNRTDNRVSSSHSDWNDGGSSQSSHFGMVDRKSRDDTSGFTCMQCREAPNQRCTLCSRYSKLLDDERWEYLSSEFERCGSLVYGIGQQPILENLIQKGFCAIKSDGCKDHRSPTCPACLPEWREYVDQIPSSHKLNSVIICPIIGSVVSYDNPPLTSPGGYVLSENGIRTMTRDNKHIQVPCPRTKELVNPEDFKKIFIT